MDWWITVIAVFVGAPASSVFVSFLLNKSKNDVVVENEKLKNKSLQQSYYKIEVDALTEKVDSLGIENTGHIRDMELIQRKTKTLEDEVTSLKSEKGIFRDWLIDIRDWRNNPVVMEHEKAYPFPPQPPGYEV